MERIDSVSCPLGHQDITEGEATPNRYLIEILYSDEDGGFIAVVPELPGCSAFGKTEMDALVEIRAAIALWLETARAEGWPIPEPAGRLLARS